MGDTDVLAKAYLSDRARFADAFNFAAYGGKSVIHPDELSPVGTESLILPGTRGARGRAGERRRDGLVLWAAMRDVDDMPRKAEPR